MKTPDIPSIPGIEIMTLLQMNNIHIVKNHTLLTPEILESISKTSS